MATAPPRIQYKTWKLHIFLHASRLTASQTLKFELMEVPKHGRVTPIARLGVELPISLYSLTVNMLPPPSFWLNTGFLKLQVPFSKAVGQSGSQIVRQSGSWAVGQSSCQAIKSLLQHHVSFPGSVFSASKIRNEVSHQRWKIQWTTLIWIHSI